MSGLFDQITNYSPPLLTAGQVNYKGTWDAAANSPTLTSPPASTSKGDYYVVSTAGTQFSISFAVGDWIISNGTAWEKVDLTDAVSSVFGRTGAVVGVSTDYSAVGITNTAIGASSPSTGAFTTITATSTITATGAVTGSNLSGTNTGNQTISITGDVTAAGSTGVLTASVTKINGTSLAGLTTGILKNTTTTGVPSIAVAADFPTLNQNTTGSAATLTTPRAIYGNNFDGSAALTQVIAGTYGGTGVNNGANTITIAGNVTHAGAFTQSFTATANTSLTLPTTGTLATLAGSEALSNKTITASSFSGTTGAFTTGTFTDLVTVKKAANFSSELRVSDTTSQGTGALILGDGIGLGKNVGVWRGASNSYSTVGNYLNLGGYDGVTIAVGNAALGSQTLIGSFSSTGLAVTGTLNVSGTGRFTNGNLYTYGESGDSTTGILYFNSGATNYIYGSASQFSIATAGVQRLLISSTGLAVTGALTVASSGNTESSVTSSAGTPAFTLIPSGSGIQPIIAYKTSSGAALRFGTVTGAGLAGFASQMVLDATGLGIGTTSPAGKLDVQAASGSGLTAYFRGGTYSDIAYSTGVRFIAPASTNNANRQFKFQSGDSSLTIQGIDGSGSNASDTSLSLQPSGGNVGIGTTSPQRKLSVSNGGAGGFEFGPSNTSNEILNYNRSTNQYIESLVYASNHTFYAGSGGGVRAVDITSSGNLLVGTTTANSTAANGFGAVQTSDATYLFTNHSSGTSASSWYHSFGYAGSQIGYIYQSGTTGVVYSTSSDYRLKDITGPLTDSGTFIDALKPKVGTWKSDGSKFVGFIAHEFAEVSPSSVAGEKDAVDNDGKPIYQAMQASSAEVIANLVAELQSLRQRVAALESN